MEAREHWRAAGLAVRGAAARAVARGAGGGAAARASGKRRAWRRQGGQRQGASVPFCPFVRLSVPFRLLTARCSCLLLTADRVCCSSLLFSSLLFSIATAIHIYAAAARRSGARVWPRRLVALRRLHGARGGAARAAQRHVRHAVLRGADGGGGGLGAPGPRRRAGRGEGEASEWDEAESFASVAESSRAFLKFSHILQNEKNINDLL